MNEQSAIRPPTGQDLIEIWKRQRWWALGTAALTAASVCIVVGVLPSVYRSDALILIEQPAVSQDYVKPLVGADDEQQISKLVQQVLSHSLLQQLPVVKAGQNFSEDDFEALREQVSIEVLRENSDPRRPAGKPYGLKVSFRSRAAKPAQEGANELATLVVQAADHMIVQQAKDTVNVLRSQLALAVSNLRRTSQALADFQKQYAGQLPIEQQLTIETLSRLQGQMNENDQAIARARQTIADLRASNLATTSDDGEEEDSASKQDPDLARLETDLQSLNDKLADLESRYKPNHPDVIKTRDQIQRLEALVEQKKAKTAKTKTAKPSKTGAAASAATASRIADNQAELDARVKQQSQFEKEAARYQANLSSIPLRAQEYSELERDYEAAKKNYETLRDEVKAADQTSDVYKENKGVHFRIQDYATLPDIPEKPVRWKLNLGGLAAAIFLGLLIAAVLELRDTSMKSDRDVEYYLGVRNLALLPAIFDPAAATQTRRTSNRLIPVAIALVLVLGGINLYLYFVRL